MAFWNDKSLEPKRKHRWLMTISDIPAFVIKTTNKPSFSINETEHNYFGHRFYYPGMVTWNEITLTLVDPIDPDVSRKVLNILRRSGYVEPSEHDSNMLHTISKEESVAALGSIVKIKQVEHTGTGTDVLGTNVVVEEWELYSPWIKEAKFGDLDYSDDGLVEIELTIRYDWAIIR